MGLALLFAIKQWWSFIQMEVKSPRLKLGNSKFRSESRIPKKLEKIFFQFWQIIPPCQCVKQRYC